MEFYIYFKNDASQNSLNEFYNSFLFSFKIKIKSNI